MQHSVGLVYTSAVCFFTWMFGLHCAEFDGRRRFPHLPRNKFLHVHHRSDFNVYVQVASLEAKHGATYMHVMCDVKPPMHIHTENGL